MPRRLVDSDRTQNRVVNKQECFHEDKCGLNDPIISIFFTASILCSVFAAHCQEVDPREKRQMILLLGYTSGATTERRPPNSRSISRIRNGDRAERSPFSFPENRTDRSTKPEKAARAYRQFLAEHPKSQYADIAAYRLAEIHLDLREGAKARAHLEPLLEKEISPDLEGKRLLRSRLAASISGESETAINCGCKGREKFPQGRTISKSLWVSVSNPTASVVGRSLEKNSPVWVEANEPKSAGPYPDALSKLAETYEKLDRTQEAKQTWLKLGEIATDPAILEKALLSAAKNAFQLEQWSAMDGLAPRLAQGVNSPASRLQMNLLFGNRHYREKEWKKAGGFYAKALEGWSRFR